MHCEFTFAALGGLKALLDEAEKYTEGLGKGCGAMFTPDEKGP